MEPFMMGKHFHIRFYIEPLWFTQDLHFQGLNIFSSAQHADLSMQADMAPEQQQQKPQHIPCSTLKRSSVWSSGGTLQFFNVKSGNKMFSFQKE